MIQLLAYRSGIISLGSVSRLFGVFLCNVFLLRSLSFRWRISLGPQCCSFFKGGVVLESGCEWGALFLCPFLCKRKVGLGFRKRGFES